MSIGSGNCGRQQLHFLFLPYLAHGHMIPMLDVARVLCSQGGASGTFVTTPRNAHLLRPTIEHYNAALGLSIDLLLVPFRGPEFGLPEGVESHATLPPGLEHMFSFARAVVELQGPVGDALRDCSPDCFVADVYFAWATRLAAEHGIPRLVFQWSGLFSLSLMNAIASVYDQMPQEAGEGTVVPCLPHRVTVTRWQLPETFRFPGAIPALMQSESDSFGVIFNSFRELEPEYADHYLAQANTRRKVYCIGPVSLAGNPIGGAGGEQKSEHPSLGWLDSKPTGSVLYVSFGTLSKLKGEQLRELAKGLEDSGHAFLWIVDCESGGCDWMPDGFEERIEREGKGLVVKDWAPQREILSHNAVGGFLTHCGWNSVIESLAAGVPIATWPQQHDQFINEKLVVEVLQAGTAVREGWKGDGVGVEEDPVTAREVTVAVRKVMATEDGSVGMRARAKVHAGNAVVAVAVGGSAYRDVSRLLEDIRAYPSP